ncbi:MAG: RibD family protein [Chitinophagaceae bacterium]|nr:MAG: RibD family protein [Chitinophagaceae bacterium]
MSRRPYITCLMMTSLDGKILSSKWGNDPTVLTLIHSFEEAHEKIGISAWIVGRTTMERDFTKGAAPVYKDDAGDVPPGDFVARTDATSFAIALDGHGRLGWKKAEMLGDHVISILTEGVPVSYLAHLRDIGVSYIIGGKHNIDLKTAMEKLYSLFGIEKLMLEGGGKINGSFLNEGLIDEHNQLLLPMADGSVDTSSVFEIEASVKKEGATLFRLDSIKKLDNDVLWLKYLKK